MGWVGGWLLGFFLLLEELEEGPPGRFEDDLEDEYHKEMMLIQGTVERHWSSTIQY